MDYRITGAMLNSALYLTGVFALGLVGNSVWPCRLAIATAGVTYLSYLAQVVGPDSRATSDVLTFLSIALGLAAGLTLFL